MASGWSSFLSGFSTNLGTASGSTANGMGNITAGAPVLASHFSGLKSCLTDLSTLVSNFQSGGWVENSDVASGAAIAYSKLALSNSIVAGDLTTGCVTSAKILDGTIVNGDISSSAAIATSKIASGTLTSGTILATDTSSTPTFGLKRSDGSYYLSGDSNGWAFGGASGSTNGSIRIGTLKSNDATVAYDATNGWDFKNTSGGDATITAGAFNFSTTTTATGTALVHSSGNFIRRSSSLRSLKENIAPADCLGLIDRLRVRKFTFKVMPEHSPEEAEDLRDNYQIGFIADEVHEDSDGKLSIVGEWDGVRQPINWRDRDIIACLVAEVQDLKRRVAELEAK